ncbi:MAG: MaoC family dehydratase [Bradyrhizobium icense]|nr:MAG: MaoC family dehydratase [Bradyrhizobium icense]
MNFYEDMEIGARRAIGAYTFTAEAIKKFAGKYDPQRFHLDEEEGRQSLFGGLAASGWHVGSACMKMLVADGQRRVKEALARGEKVAVWGPSPGFRDLRWLRPVLAGDTVSFSTGIESKRVSESRPGWGIVQTQTGGVNQRGEEVYSIRATAFVPLRDAPAEKAR